MQSRATSIIVGALLIVLVCVALVGVFRLSTSSPGSFATVPQQMCGRESRIQWRIPPDSVGHCESIGADDHLCEAGLRGVACAHIVASSVGHGPLAISLLNKLRRVKRPWVVGGDSMARQVFLRLVAMLRSPAASYSDESQRLSLEHYFHCDAHYYVFANGTDRLDIDVHGHCQRGEDAAFPVRIDAALSDAAVLSVHFVWHQAEHIGNRFHAMVAACKVQPVVVYVPTYSWSPANTQASVELITRISKSALRVAVGLTRPDIAGPRSTQHAELLQRNKALRRDLGSEPNVFFLSTMADSLAPRCDGVHFMCVLVPSMAKGVPTGLRAPCPTKCSSETLVHFWEALLKSNKM